MSKTKVVLSVCFVTILTAVAWPLMRQGAAGARVTPDRQEPSSYYVDRAVSASEKRGTCVKKGTKFLGTNAEWNHAKAALGSIDTIEPIS